jgi:hypothetical protein
MHKPLPTASLLHELLTYDPNTGDFIWKERTSKHFTPTPHRTAEWLCRWWNTRFANVQAGSLDPHQYVLIRINGIDYRAHRVAWVMTYGVEPKYIDHINGVCNDNRIENLRSVTSEDNTKNAKRRCDNQSGVTGVSYFRPKNTWRARINYKNATITLGYYRTKEEAIAARKAAETLYAYHTNHGR